MTESPDKDRQLFRYNLEYARIIRTYCQHSLSLRELNWCISVMSLKFVTYRVSQYIQESIPGYWRKDRGTFSFWRQGHTGLNGVWADQSEASSARKVHFQWNFKYLYYNYLIIKTNAYENILMNTTKKTVMRSRSEYKYYACPQSMQLSLYY